MESITTQHRRSTSLVGLLAAGSLAFSAVAFAPSAGAAKWDGNVGPLIKDSRQQLKTLSDKKVNKWFGVPKKYAHEFGPAAVNALATTTDATKARQLGKVQVIYNVDWPKMKVAPAATLTVQYRNGTFKKFVPVDSPFIGSFGFAVPKLELPEAVKKANKYRKNHPAKIPAEYVLDGAQLQKADAPPPTLEKLRWVVTYLNPDDDRVHQVLVYMNGKVEFGV